MNELSAAVLRALREWHKGNGTPIDDLPRLYAHVQQQTGIQADNVSSTIAVLNEGLRSLDLEDADAASLLRRRFQHNVLRQTLASQRSISVPHLDRLQKAAVNKLTATLIAAERELEQQAQSARSARFADLRLRLDLAAGDHRLFGIDDQLSELTERLESPNAPHMLLVEGLGGIGKTALTVAALRRILDGDTFDDIAWVTAQQQRFLFSGNVHHLHNPVHDTASVILALAEQLLPVSARPLPFVADTVLPLLRTRLSTQRTLLVVDNLETLSETEALIARLGTLADPTKLLFTSRVYPSSDRPLYRLVVPELQQRHAGQMVRHLAEQAGIEALTHEDDALLVDIYAALGGHPLALRLLVGQCRHHSPADVLDALRTRQGRTEGQLYSFIYQQIWNNLDEPTRDVLLAFILTPSDGADRAYLIAASGFDERSVHSAVAQLVDLNMVEHRLNQAGQSRYAIHSLTRTFLQTHVLS